MRSTSWPGRASRLSRAEQAYLMRDLSVIHRAATVEKNKPPPSIASPFDSTIPVHGRFTIQSARCHFMPQRLLHMGLQYQSNEQIMLTSIVSNRQLSRVNAVAWS